MEEYRIDKIDENNPFLPEIDIITSNSGEIFFDEVEKEIRKARKNHKKVQYYSKNIIIYSLEDEINIGHSITIFETLYRKNNRVECSYLANKKLHGTYLLDLINKAELVTRKL